MPQATTCITVLVILLCLAGTRRLAAEEPPPAAEHPEVAAEQQFTGSLSGGYRMASSSGSAALVNPYGVNRSGAAAAFTLGLLGPEQKLRAAGQFLHPDDYLGELFFDYAGMVRVDLESRSLRHNLIREPLFQSFTSTTAPFMTYTAVPDSTPGEPELVTRQSRVDTRVRLGHLPAHLSLGYWRFDRSGSEQRVVSDVTFPNNTFYSVARRIDQATNEARVGVDANLGPVNLAYSFRIRDFNNQATPLTISSLPAAVMVPAEGRVTTHSAKAFSNLSGGLTATAAYSISQRENTSQRSDLYRSSQPRDTIQQISGDLSYTPLPQLSMALRYRHREVDRDTPGLVGSVYSAGIIAVQPATSTTKDAVSLSAAWRPVSRLMLRGEYCAELISRDQVWDAATSSLGSDANQLHSGTLAVLWRPLRTTRFHASYRYTANSQPTPLYGFDDRHTGNLLLDWSSTGRWGVSAHYRAIADRNDERSTVTAPTIREIATPRDSLHQSAGGSVWFSPQSRLVLTVTYGWLGLDARQTSLFNPADATTRTATSYTSQAHVYGLEGAYAANDRLDIGLGLHQTRSQARFQVPSWSSAAGIGTDSRLDTTETAASGRLDWRLTPHLGCLLEYRFSAYRGQDRRYDADLHQTLLSLKARW
ncbi:hypothetical protein [Trichlorobacter sp.]|uniref:hypothetical protein n=1 Tax=Trichlorobacter sp. TaxID=2911007 RepID=UPI002A3672D2|nr:hypothetical protein [Trichlorobacter sp.]MDY0384760.1 hypothetical protein [Trichlorobacter sp.]